MRNDTVPVEILEKSSRLLGLYRTPPDQGQHRPPFRTCNHNGKWGDGDGNSFRDGDTIGNAKAKVLCAGPTRSKKRSQKVVGTQASEIAKRQGAEKRNYHVFWNASSQPQYDSNDEIGKWVQEMELFQGQLTPESVKASKREVRSDCSPITSLVQLGLHTTAGIRWWSPTQLRASLGWTTYLILLFSLLGVIFQSIDTGLLDFCP